MAEDAERVRLIVRDDAKQVAAAEAFEQPRRELGIELPLEALVSLVMTFNLGIIVERLGGIETGHRQLIEWIDQWKVFLSRAASEHGGQADKSGMRRVFSRIEIGEPGTACTETFLVAGRFDTREEASNFARTSGRPPGTGSFRKYTGPTLREKNSFSHTG